jgi:alpha-galactosidase
MKFLTMIVLILLVLSLNAQKFEGLASTPPMGWNSWNNFACNVDESLIRQTADAMVSSGMRDAGYVYINIDDCWQGLRDSLGFIQPDPQRFPSGIKALGDYIHSLGLKFGLYSDAGKQTCGGRPGSRGYEYQDALQYAKWGVDYLKYDWCNTDSLKAEGAYITMRDALYAAGRPVVFSLCEWGNNNPWIWGKYVGHLWRTTGDITACFDCIEDHGSWKSWGILQILDKQEGLRMYAGPNHWNDPDMMEVGNGMSVAEDRAHISLWCMLAAPLIAGNDLVHMSKETTEILTNKEAIAVDQDALGIQGFKFLTERDLEIWVKPLSNDEWAFCFLNRGMEEKIIDFTWSDYIVKDDLKGKSCDFRQTEYKIRDLWMHNDLGTSKDPFKTKIQSHDVRFLKLSPVK